MGPGFDLDKFLLDYKVSVPRCLTGSILKENTQIDCTAAIDRLTRVGVPATIEHKTFPSSKLLTRALAAGAHV